MMDDDDIDYGISVLLQENATLKRQLADVTAKRDALMDCFFEFETIAPNGELMASVLDMHKRLESLESQLADAQARLAGYEVGYDPKVDLPKHISKQEDEKVVIKDVYKRFYIGSYNTRDKWWWVHGVHWLKTDEIIRWFPLPGAAFSELAKGAE